MATVKWWIDAVYLLFERIKGVAFFEEIVTPPALTEHLTGYSVSGYELRLYCQRKKYRRTYLRWSWLNRTYSAFRVYSITSNDAPPCLREACELDIYFPAFAPSFLSENLQKELAIQAYLDILIERLAKPV
jgi:hypothetical protein